MTEFLIASDDIYMSIAGDIITFRRYDGSGFLMDEISVSFEKVKEMYDKWTEEILSNNPSKEVL